MEDEPVTEEMGGEMACQAPRGWWDAEEAPLESEPATAAPPDDKPETEEAR